MVALGEEISSAREAEVRKRIAEITHERFDVRMTLALRTQRLRQKHVGSGELVNDAEIGRLIPEIGEPSHQEPIHHILAHPILPIHHRFLHELKNGCLSRASFWKGAAETSLKSVDLEIHQASEWYDFDNIVALRDLF